jgi:hypothetical protein
VRKRALFILFAVLTSCHVRQETPNKAALRPFLGDYGQIGVRAEDGRTDIPKLMAALDNMGAGDYMHLVWGEKQFPRAWDDFKLMAAEFHKAGKRLWLYLVPPSEPPAPAPFGHDYIRWAEECARLAKAYPSVSGICIDDFNGNLDLFTPVYCLEMKRAAKAIAPRLNFLVVNYFGFYESMEDHVIHNAIDGVVFPYFYPQRNHSDSSRLMAQIEAFRGWLDGLTKKNEPPTRLSLVVMVYATKHSQSSDSPTPAFVSRCLAIGLKATEKGLAQGVVTYGLPKDDRAFIEAVGAVYKTGKIPQAR